MGYMMLTTVLMSIRSRVHLPCLCASAEMGKRYKEREKRKREQRCNKWQLFVSSEVTLQELSWWNTSAMQGHEH